MPLSSAPTTTKLPIAIPSLPYYPEGFRRRSFKIKKGLNLYSRKISEYNISRKLDFVTNSISGNSDTSVGFDPFPSDYSQLLEQAKEATELALKDNKKLMEIEFPTAGLESVPVLSDVPLTCFNTMFVSGDGEGGIEMTGKMLVVEELYNEAVATTARKLIIFNGELDRIRSGCILLCERERERERERKWGNKTQPY
ncbi:hypothetical protein TEA_023318 [Camellia sinensis var. sinensis]|uniref:DUF1995 domain-containing protein n=1 Tax=Camellia sinensis var. sinensis TaxID=542762 RepID=A0A4S4EUZ3_CAMSN|nr:hypothetical protein TEA_023318 [Camellia sinensis var. sinensis]